MIRLAGGGSTDYWVSAPFTWSPGSTTLTFTHNKGKYSKSTTIFKPGIGYFRNYQSHDRDASGTGGDYGFQIAENNLNDVKIFSFGPNEEVTITNCVCYIEFLDFTLTN
jgi:hypothetical protein